MISKRLALARNCHGCTPLHTSIIYEQTEIIRFIAANFPLVLNAPDYVKIKILFNNFETLFTLLFLE